jgi:hypothetical protein
MANVKIVDVSNNVTKKISISDLLRATPLGTAALPAIAIDGDPNTGIYSPGADQVAISTNGTGRLFVDSSGNVGAGTSSPTFAAGGGIQAKYATFSSFRSTVGTNTGIDFAAGSDGKGYVYLRDNADLLFGTNNTEQMRLTSAGRLGLGTSSVSAKCEIAYSSTAPSLSSNSGAGLALGGTSSVQLNFGTNPSAPYNAWIQTRDTGTNAAFPLSINPLGGAVGIGTTPSYLLHLYGSNSNIAVHDTGANGTRALIEATNSAVYYGSTYSTSNIPTIFSQTGGSGGIERMRIDTSGRLLVGTSSSASAGGVTAQHAFSHSTSSQWAAQVEHTTAAGNAPFGLAIKYTAATPNGTSSDFLFCEDATAIRARIYSNGGLGNYSANNVNLSDRNAKKDIAPAAGTWDCLKEWEIVHFRYKDQPEDTDLSMGVIAQQVAESCPEVITVFQEAKEATETDPAQEERIGVKEQQMMWMAIKALQEAQLRIETLEAKVAALEGA